MKKANKIIAQAIAAILVLNQAVFLLPLVGLANAQIISDNTTTTSTRPSVYDYILEKPSTTYIDPGTKNIIQPDSTINPDVSTKEVLYNLEPITTTDISFTFVETLKSPFSQRQPLTILLNQEVDKVVIFINGPRSEYLYPTGNDKLYYYFIWDTTRFPDGSYKIIATASKGGDSFTNSFITEVKNNFTNIVDPAPLSAPENKIATTSFNNNTIPELNSLKQESGIKLIQPYEGSTLNGPIRLRVASFGPIRRVEFLIFKDNAYKTLGSGRLNSTGHEWEYDLDTAYLANGDYYLMAYAWDDKEIKFVSNKILIHIKNIEYKSPENIESDPGVKTPIIQPEERELISPDNFFSPPDKYGEEPKYINGENEILAPRQPESFLPWECKEAGINERDACEFYLAKPNLPQACREANAQSFEECEKIMMPAECREANILGREECEKYLRLKNMPAECREAKVSDPAECGKILFKINGPVECVKAGILTEQECDTFVFKKQAPPDCREANIFSPEACKKYMLEKYGGLKNIPAEQYPSECQKADAQTPEECDAAMAKKYLPRQCQDEGITDERQCKTYLDKKYMPAECQKAGVSTMAECNKTMFKKYAPKECLAAGIEEEKACEDHMFNKYAPKIKCEGMGDDQCRESIKDRHLGNIVSKQTQFQELKDKVGNNSGNSTTIEELEKNLEIAKEMIPFKEKKTGVKIMAAQENVILDKNEDLIQTASVALMVDSDQDGLPDDMEKRLGTNPDNADTDGDSYKDGEELKNNYNALGQGELKAAFAPIDEAIIQNKTLGQPKAEGETTEDMTIESVANISDKQDIPDEGYNFSGQAEPDSTITLYVYSDLPLVITTKVDRYGNWQYELKESLIEGEHEVYVAVNDNTGKVVKKSKPLNFFISEAKAVTVEDFVSAVKFEQQTETESLAKIYIIIASITVALGILLFIVFIKQKNKISIFRS